MNYNPPYALGCKGWRLFNDEFEKKAPIRYFITERLPSFFSPIKYLFVNATDYVRYRTYNRYFMIDTGLEPGYYEIKHKMLHGMFNLLKDFVEKEQAWSFQCWNSQHSLNWKERRIPLYYELFYRKPEYGVQYLEWAATLDDPTLPVMQQSIEQAVTSREILALYKWWTIIRPLRDEESDETYDDQGFSMGPLDDDFDHTAPDYVNYMKQRQMVDSLEQTWEEEDTEMLIRLVKIRSALWT